VIRNFVIRNFVIRTFVIRNFVIRSFVPAPQRDKRGVVPSDLLDKWGLIRVQMKGVLPWLFSWALRAGTKDFCPALVALVGRVQNIFFLAVHYFISFVSNAQ
jgi:hypothetical protein